MSLSLKSEPKLADYQLYVKEMIVERGFKNDTPDKVIILMNKELGGLGQALRLTWGSRDGVTGDQKALLSKQLADTFIYMLEFCNMFDISLEEAFRMREAENMKRDWKPYNFY
jgi:NTP pyrophosphatase (non-canonical NTP hydrolase)